MRAVVESQLSSPFPQRYFYAGPMFRYERPQKGRSREFSQIGVESIGAGSPFHEVEVIDLACQVLKAIDIDMSTVTLQLNSLGDEQSRAAYKTDLADFLQKHIQLLSQDSQQRFKRGSVLRILDSKEEEDLDVLLSAPKLFDYLTTAAKEHFLEVETLLRELNITYTINPYLVRGLDYYSHTIFEFVDASGGRMGTILAGGRYDDLVSHLGGPALVGVGWAAGLERLSLQSRMMISLDKPIVVISVPEEDRVLDVQITAYSLLVARTLRMTGRRVIYLGFGPRKQMKRANKMNAKFAILVGVEEMQAGSVTKKDLERRVQETHSLSDIVKYI